MSNYFMVLSANQTSYSDITDYLQGLLGYHTKIETKQGSLLVYYDHIEESIGEALLAFEQEIMTDMKVIYGIRVMDKALEYALEDIQRLAPGIYSLKEFLNFAIRNNFCFHWRRIVLRKYADDSTMEDIIRKFFACNLNISLAAKELFLHRNTLINKLDRFYEVTNFDLRNFYDAYIVNSCLVR